jgi:hypothetical protein
MSMLMVLIFWDATIDGTSNRYYYRRCIDIWGRYINTSGFENKHILNVLMIDSIDIISNTIYCHHVDVDVIT